MSCSHSRAWGVERAVHPQDKALVIDVKGELQKFRKRKREAGGGVKGMEGTR